jgi:hypothetical protein
MESPLVDAEVNAPEATRFRNERRFPGLSRCGHLPDDPLFGKGVLRADGRKIYPAYLFEVKKPEESK